MSKYIRVHILPLEEVKVKVIIISLFTYSLILGFKSLGSSILRITQLISFLIVIRLTKKVIHGGLFILITIKLKPYLMIHEG